jgi:hypothetical protein
MTDTTVIACPWSWGRKVLFRSGVVYFTFYSATQGLTIYNIATDTTQQYLSLWNDNTDSVTLHYAVPKKGQLTLEGKVGTDSVHVQ